MSKTFDKTCPKCGERLGYNNVDATTGGRHYCEPKVKIYTREEIEKLEKERREDTKQ